VPLSKPLPTKAAPTASTTSRASRTGSLTLGEALDRWDTYLQASDKIASPRTIDSYRYGTGKLVAHLGSQYELHAITPGDIEALMAGLKAGGMKPGGRMGVYRPIRTFFRWCVSRELLAVSPGERVEAPVVKVQPVEFVSEAEWQAILATCSARSRWAFRARRDLAILHVLGTTGARLSEVAGLTLGDIDMESKTLLVHGKGGKDRLLPLLPEAATALQTYLTLERPRSPFSGIDGAVWLTSRGRLTANGIAQLVAERGKAAGIARRVHPHELRHRFVASALKAGMPGPLVMALSGHSTPSMLNRYGAWNRSQDAMDMLRELHAKRATA